MQHIGRRAPLGPRNQGAAPSEKHDKLVATRRRVEAHASRVARLTTTASPQERHVSLDELGSGWRAALDAADDALSAARFDLSPQELRVRRGRLTQERAGTAPLIAGLAREMGSDDGLVGLMIPRAQLKRALGLPQDVEACVFNLEGVLIGSAAVHAAAWAETLNPFIWTRIERTGGRYEPAPYDPRTDYPHHMHGKPRLEGLRAFLASRGISLPTGAPEDAPGAETVYGLANRKHQVLLRKLGEQGVTAFAGSRRYLEIAREVGVHCGGVSASTNTREILERAGLAGVIEGCVDGNTIVAEHLRPAPAPDALLAVCSELGVEPRHAAAFETSAVGVTAAHTGEFRLVVGVGAAGQVETLRSAGADVVVTGLAELVDQVLVARY